MIVKAYRTTNNELIPIDLYRQIKKVRRELWKLIAMSDDLTTQNKGMLYNFVNLLDDITPDLEGFKHAHNGR